MIKKFGEFVSERREESHPKSLKSVENGGVKYTLYTGGIVQRCDDGEMTEVWQKDESSASLDFDDIAAWLESQDGEEPIGKYPGYIHGKAYSIGRVGTQCGPEGVRGLHFSRGY